MENFIKQAVLAFFFALSGFGGLLARLEGKEAFAKGEECAGLAFAASREIVDQALSYHGTHDEGGLFGANIAHKKLVRHKTEHPANFCDLFNLSREKGREEVFRFSKKHGRVYEVEASKQKAGKEVRRFKDKKLRNLKGAIKNFHGPWVKRAFVEAVDEESVQPWIRFFYEQLMEKKPDSVTDFENFSCTDFSKSQFTQGFCTELGKLLVFAKKDGGPNHEIVAHFALSQAKTRGFIKPTAQVIMPVEEKTDSLMVSGSSSARGSQAEQTDLWTSWPVKAGLGVACVASLVGGGFADSIFVDNKAGKKALSPEELEQARIDRNKRRIVGFSLSVLFAGLLAGACLRENNQI